MDADKDTVILVLTSVGIDIGKDVFRIVCFGPDGKIAFRRKIKRLALAETFRKHAAMHRRDGRLPQRKFSSAAP